MPPDRHGVAMDPYLVVICFTCTQNPFMFWLDRPLTPVCSFPFTQPTDRGGES